MPQADSVDARSQFYIPALDGLRFVAFSFIFLRHLIAIGAWANDSPAVRAVNWFEARAWIGVDIFFALSAFLITEILLRERESGGIKPGHFWARRILRIWPLYYLAILLGFVVLPLLALPGVGPPMGAQAWAELLTTHALPFALLLGNWSTALSGFPSSWIVSPLWSISIEEQFYLFWPLILARVPLRWLPMSLFGTLLLALAYRFTLVTAVPTVTGVRIYSDTLAHIDCILVGVFVCLLWRGDAFRRFGSLRHWSVPIIAMLIVGAMLAAVADVNEITGIRAVWTYLVVAVLCGCLMLCALANPYLGYALSRPILVWGGRLSFGMYVFAAASEAFARTVFPSSTIGYVLLATAATSGLAALSYRGYERRFLMLRKRFSSVRAPQLDAADVAIARAERPRPERASPAGA